MYFDFRLLFGTCVAKKIEKLNKIFIKTFAKREKSLLCSAVAAFLDVIYLRCFDKTQVTYCALLLSCQTPFEV
jgi:hypothetical protein